MNKKIADKISKYFVNEPIQKAWLFGSYSRSEENKKSDIDILVKFLPDFKITLLQYVHIMNELQKITGKKVDLVEEGQLKTFATRTVEEDKILIYERANQR